MSATYASKSVQRNGARSSKRYWYDASKKSSDADEVKAHRLPADAIEQVVRDEATEKLPDRAWLTDALSRQQVSATVTAMLLTKLDAFTANTSEASSNTDLRKWIDPLLKRMDLASDTMCITLDLATLTSKQKSDRNMHLQFELPFTLRQNGRAKPIVIATVGQSRQRDPNLIALVADAKRWMTELLEGRVASVHEITEPAGLRSGAVSQILPLAYLAPDISTAILEGRQPASLNAKRLRELRDLPLDWSEQRRVLSSPGI